MATQANNVAIESSQYNSSGILQLPGGGTGQTTSIVPAGAILLWGNATPPSGWLICNGSAISRTTYSTLFSVMGTTFGSGDGSTTFNIPNYQGSKPIGVNVTYTLASTGGSATTTFSTSNIPAHNHTASVSDPGHSHNTNILVMDSSARGGNSGVRTNAGNGSTYQTDTVTTGISVSTGNTGSGTAATTISPYLAMHFIVKT